MKRFWREAAAADGAVLLDGRPVRTPKGAALCLPTAALADAVAAEWAGVGERLDPSAMPLTGLANAAIDLVSPDPPAFAGRLAAFAAHDLTCYRAEGPQPLVARQVAAWEPVLKGVERRHGLVFRRTAGVAPVEQPAATLAGVDALLRRQPPFVLAALSPIVTLSGSVVLALALLEGDLAPDAAFAAAHVDADWQADCWGADEEAVEARAFHAAAFGAAARFLALVRG
jgi:chaperone required for assembly of F1-ATPase